MSHEVELPNGDTIEFPDYYTQDEIDIAVNQHLSPPERKKNLLEKVVDPVMEKVGVPAFEFAQKPFTDYIPAAKTALENFEASARFVQQSPNASTAQKIGAGVAAGAVPAIKGFENPLGAALMLSGGALPKTLHTLMTAAFTALAAKEGGAAAGELVEALKAKDWGKAAESATQIVGAGAQGLGALELPEGVKNLGERTPTVRQQPAPIPRPKMTGAGLTESAPIKPPAPTGFGKFYQDSLKPLPETITPEATQEALGQVGQSGELQPLPPDPSIAPAATVLPQAAQSATEVSGAIDRTPPPKPEAENDAQAEEDPMAAMLRDIESQGGAIAEPEPAKPEVSQSTVVNRLAKWQQEDPGSGGLEPLHSEIKTSQDAENLGMSVKTPEDLKALQDLQAFHKEQVQIARSKKDMNRAFRHAIASQHLREAYEAATGTGGIGDRIRKGNPDTQFPADQFGKPQVAPENLTPAILVNGKVTPGEDHVAAYEKAKETTPDTSGAQEVFLNKETGEVLNRQQAAAATGLETKTEPGKLHSTDLPPIDEVDRVGSMSAESFQKEFGGPGGKGSKWADEASGKATTPEAQSKLDAAAKKASEEAAAATAEAEANPTDKNLQRMASLGSKASILNEAAKRVQRNAPAVPKLAPGEKGTGDLLKTVEEPLKLVGEKGTDVEEAAADKVATDKAKADAAAAAEKAQGQLPIETPKDQKPVSSRREKTKKIDDKLKSLKFKKPGDVIDGVTGLPIVVWDYAVDVVRLGVQAGLEIAEAIESALALVKQKHPDLKFNEDEFRKQLAGPATPTPEPATSESKPAQPKKERAKAERAPNALLDAIEQHVGKIKFKPGKGSAYRADYSEEYFQARKAYPNVFSESGVPADEAVQNLRDAGVVGKNFDASDLWDAMITAKRADSAFSRGRTPEQVRARWLNLLQDQESRKTAEVKNVGELHKGDLFRMGGYDFEVTHIDPDGGIQVKGPEKFGVQDLPDDQDIRIDKGSFERAEVKPDLFTEPPTPEPGAAPVTPPAATGENSPMGIKNSENERLRAKLGLPPIVKPTRRGWEEAWDKAMDHMSNDPTWLDGSNVDGKRAPGLIEELSKNPRPITDEENAALVARQIDLHTQHQDLTRKLAKAAGTPEAASLSLRVGDLMDRLYELHQITNKVGTENARGLNARKMMANEDYTLVQMELDKMGVNDGKPLTTEQRDEILRLHQKIAESAKKVADLEERQKDMVSKQQANAEIDRLKALHEAQLGTTPPKFSAEVLRIAEEIVAKADKMADAARERLRKKFAQTGSGADPTMIFEWAQIGASYLAHAALDLTKFTLRLAGEAKEFGAEAEKFVTDNASDIYEAAKGHLENTARGKSAKVKQAVKEAAATSPIDKAKARIKEKVADKEEGDIYFEVQKLCRQLIENGVTDREELVERVHQILQETMPDISRREAMDAISGYGRFKALSKDEISMKLRGMKGELRELGKLEDIENREPLKKSGMEQAEPTDEERRITKKVEDAKRKYGVVVTDPASQLKSALDALKKRASNQITDLEHEIQTREKIVKNKTPAPTDAELEALKQRRDELKEIHAQVFPKEGITDAQRVKLAMAALERQTKRYEQHSADMEVMAQRNKVPETPELLAARAARDAARSAYDEMRDLNLDYQRQQDVATVQKRIEQLQKVIADKQAQVAAGGAKTNPRPQNRPSPNREIESLMQQRDELNQRLRELKKPLKTPEERALAAAKTRMSNSIAKLQEKIKNGDYTRVKRKPLVPDRQLQELRAENEGWKLKFRQGLNRDRLAKRTALEKTGDFVGKMVRFNILSGASVMAKLLAAGIFRVATAPIKEAIGSGISALNPSLAARAERGGGFNMQAEREAITQTVTQGMMDAYNIIRKGKSDLDLIYGHDPGVPQTLLDFWGNVHSMLKAPIKRNEFTRSFRKRIDAAAKQGVDVQDPLVQMEIGTKAYEDANRAIFMQKNAIHDAWKRALSRFEEVDKTTGHKSGGNVALGAAARAVFPVTKVPLNIAAESLESVVGGITGSYKLGRAYREGMESLPPEQADLIYRHLENGSLGAALLLMGYFFPNVLGGFYQRGTKRPKDDVKPGDARIGGLNVDKKYLESPLALVSQLGATIRRVSDSKLRKRDRNTQGFSEGAMAGALGLADAIPFIKESLDVAKAYNPAERDQFFAELAKSRIEPQLIQQIAEYLDRNDKGEKIKRKPRNPTETFEAGIPGLRQNVPIKQSK